MSKSHTTIPEFSDTCVEDEVTYYDTVVDVLDNEVLPAVGDYASDYDVDAIAGEIAEYDAEHRGYRVTVDADEFWAIVSKYELV